MHQLETLAKLAEFFVTFASVETELEDHRVKLAELEDFEPLACFQKIDVSNSGFVTVSDLLNYLSQQNIQLSERQVSSFFEVLHSDNDDKLNYTEFLDAVLPTTNLLLRQVAARRHTYRPTARKAREADVDQKLAEFLKLEILLYNKVNSQCRSLVNDPDWDVYNAFFKIDTEKAGGIDRFCLLIFLKKVSKLNITFDDILPLFRRIDTDNDGKLSYPEFQFIFSLKPLQEVEEKGLQTSKNQSLIQYPQERELLSDHKRVSQEPSQEIKERATVLSSSLATTTKKPSEDDHKFDKNYEQSNVGGIKEKISERSNSKYSNHLQIHELVEDVLKRSQAARSSSVVNSQKTPTKIEKSAVMHHHHHHQEEEAMPSIPRASPHKKVRYEDEINTDSDFANPMTFETRQTQNAKFKASILKGNAYNPRRYPTFEPNDPELESSNREQNRIVSNHTIAIPLNEHSHESSFARDRENLPRFAQLNNTPENSIRYEFRERGEQVDPLPSRHTSNEPHALREKQRQLARDSSFSMQDSQRPLLSAKDPISSLSRQNNSSHRINIGSDSRGHSRSNSISASINETHSRRDLSFRAEESTKRFIPDENSIFLAKCLKEIAELEHQLNSVREILAYQSDFTPLPAYKLIFDRSGSNSCNLKRFMDILHKHGIKIEPEMAEVVFKEFDHDRDGIISFHDFERLIKTRDLSALEVLEGRKSDYIQKNATLNLVTQFFGMAVELEVNVEAILEKIQKTPNFKLGDVLRAVDSQRSGFITETQLKDLAWGSRSELEVKDIQAIMTRYDTERTGKISIGYFIEQLSPKIDPRL